MMRAYIRRVALVAVTLAASAVAARQSAPQWQIGAGGSAKFDVASVKISRSDAPASSNFPLGPGDGYAATGGLFQSTNQPLAAYIAFALKLRENDLVGVPAWAFNDRYDITARRDGERSKDQMRLMMQSLLEDRFKMRVHHQTKEGPVYALVLSKPGKLGPQLYRETDACRSGSPSSVLNLPQIPCGNIGPIPASANDLGRLGGRAVTMARIAAFLKSPYTGVDRPVMDRTGLSGAFDFSVEWSLPADPTEPPAAQRADSGPTFFEALQKQLGLKLQSSKGPVDVVVIDHIEPPSPN